MARFDAKLQNNFIIIRQQDEKQHKKKSFIIFPLRHSNVLNSTSLINLKSCYSIIIINEVFLHTQKKNFCPFDEIRNEIIAFNVNEKYKGNEKWQRRRDWKKEK